MKRPSFQFYPSDWLRDTALRSCSIGARGLWIDMICFMHEGNPYGTLKVGSKVILPVNLAAMVGVTLPEVEGWLVELESAHVFDRGDEGEIMSRRMIRDENLRNIRAAGGKKGGNPALMVNSKDNPKVNLEDKQKPTPSSSSPSSSSISITNPKKNDSRGEEDEIFAKWNLFPELPKIARITDNRRSAARTRLKDPFFREHWKSGMEAIPERPFLLGQNDRGWKADIDWFLTPEAITKIVEGKYQSNQPAQKPKGGIPDGFGV